MKDNNTGPMRSTYRLALFSCMVAVIVIVLGAFTRLVDAGLGCPDWPGCYGHVLWPNTVSEIEQANQAFPDTPVALDKTWPEMVHRYLASSLGLLTIAIVILSWRVRHDGGPLKLPFFLLAFVILQGLFGMWTVTLKLWPQIVTAHLLGGFATLSLLWLLVLRLRKAPWLVPFVVLEKLRRFRPWVIIGLIIVILQIALGGWTTSNYAAVACPDLPTCQGKFIPEMNFSAGFNFAQAVGPNYLGGTMDNESRVAIHFAHRVGALVTAIYLLVLCVKLIRGACTRHTKAVAKIVLYILVVQIVLGLSNIVFSFPVAIAVAHNLVGAILLVTMVTLTYFVFTAKLQARD